MLRRTGFILLLVAAALTANRSVTRSVTAQGAGAMPVAVPEVADGLPAAGSPAPTAVAFGPAQQRPEVLASADAFYAMRNPAPGESPAQGPVARALTAKRLGDGAAGARTGGPAWAPLGPAPTTTSQTPAGAGVAGRINAVVSDPADTTGKTIYIGAANGGVWKTTTGGQSWTPLTDGQASPAITAVVLDPTNTQHVYAATGDYNAATGKYGSSSYFGAGVLTSQDGGTTWTLIGAATFVGQAIFDLAMSPDGQQLYVVGLSGFWVGSQTGGVWGFTPKGVGTWTSVRVNPANPNIVNLGAYGGPWVYTLSPESLRPSSVCLTTGCSTPTIDPQTDIGRATVAVDPVAGHGTIVYASLGCVEPAGASQNPCPQTNTCGGPSVCYQGWWGLYKSTDSGATYYPVSGPAASLGTAEYAQTWYDLALGVDPLNDNEVYVGLVNLWKADQSTNPATLTSISSPGVAQPSCSVWGTGRFALAQGTGCDQHGIGFGTGGSGSNGALYAVSDGGIVSSAPAAQGSAWANLNANLSLTEFEPGASISPATPGQLLAGSDGGGTQTTSGTGWQQTDAGDGGFTAIDPTDPTNTWYDSHPYLAVAKTTTASTAWSPGGGPTWSAATNGLPAAAVAADPEQSGIGVPVAGAIFLAPFAMDPGNHLNLLAGADRPYLTTNGAVSWVDISGGTTFFTAAQLQAGAGVSAVTICPNAPLGTFYLGTTDGRILRALNGYDPSPTWTDISSGLPGQWVTRIVCLANGTAYATIGGSQTVAGEHVLRLVPTDAVWRSAQGTLPDTTVSSVAVDPGQSTPPLYAATDLGVYQSLDSGTNWTLFGGGLPNVPVVDLQLDSTHGTLYAFTHGRGAWSVSIGSGESLVSPSLSTVIATPISVAADGTTTATITVTLLDATSAPVPGEAVSLGQVLSGGGVAHSTVTGPTPTTTGTNGQATFTVVDSSQERVTYSASVPADSVALAATANVLFGTPKQGDVNADGIVNATDALCELRLVAQLASSAACPMPLFNPDVDGDGDPNPPGADATDALCILRAIAQLPATSACPSFPAP
jgi:hypothetical protein